MLPSETKLADPPPTEAAAEVNCKLPLSTFNRDELTKTAELSVANPKELALEIFTQLDDGVTYLLPVKVIGSEPPLM